MENMEEKIWGVYNTFNNVEMFEQVEEYDLWKMIDSLGGYILGARHDRGKPWAANVSDKELLKAQYNLEYLVCLTRNFGVEFSKEPSTAEHVEKSKSYVAWVAFWKNHFDSMEPEVYKQFVQDKQNVMDVSKYLPIGSWKDSLENQIKNSLIYGLIIYRGS